MKRKNYADMDPTEEIRAIREEMSREFSTLRELGEYLRNKYPGASSPAKSPRGARPSGTKSGGVSAARGRKRTAES